MLLLQTYTKIQEYTASDTLLMDPASMRSLEIFKSTFDNSRNATLMDAIDGTVTAAGSRLLQDYLSAPLMCVKTINFRQDCVQTFFNNSTLSDQIHTHLKQTRDIPRILSRLQNRIQNPRELGAIRETLDQLPGIKTLLNQVAQGNCVNQLLEQIEDFQLLKEELNQALNPTLPQKIQDGGTFAKGYDEELDHLLELSLDNQSWIASLERSEQERTGIKNLKVKFNNAFGYFIEVTKANTHLVPEDYIRKQTMTNAERYYTESLKEKEKEILHAHDKSIARELFLFNQLIAKILDQAQELRKTATALAQVDLFIGWANIARIWNYCRPSVDNSNTLEIEQGRHAVVEQMLKEQTISTTTPSTFIPNDTFVESSTEQVALITGPNMAGKSTYIRQVALITLMAQIGCFVPADRAVIGLVDRIFSRVGANDELARGNSTFMVEMNETANILNNCTEKSLIILDEIGRGTSTYDGLSIAWAVLEHLHQAEESGPRTLFATHYHELVQLDKILNRLRNYCVSVKEEGDKIVFVRQVIPGTADRSYGIQVAQLAGLPKTVIGRAKTILHELETEGQILISHLHQQKQRKAPKKEAEPTSVPQLSLF